MNFVRCPLAPFLGLLLTLPQPASAGPPSERLEAIRVDAEGDPLPEGAIARFGTVRFRHPGLCYVSFTRDGDVLAAGGRAIIWSAATGKEALRLGDGEWGINCASASADGKLIAVGHSDGAVRFLSLDTSKELGRLPKQPKALEALALSPDGKTLITIGADSVIRVWDVVTCKEVSTLAGPEKGRVFALAVSPDGKTLTSLHDDSDATLYVWDVSAHKELRHFKSGQGKRLSRINSAWIGPTLAYSPDSLALALWSGYYPLRLLDINTGKEIRAFENTTTGAFVCLAFSPDGKTLAAGRDGIRLWDVKSGRELGALCKPSPTTISLAFSSDGKTLASAGEDGVIRLWNPVTRKEFRPMSGHQARVNCVCFSPNHEMLASCGFDGAVRVWNLATSKEVRRFEKYPYRVLSLAFLPDGKRLITGGDRAVRLCNLASGEELQLVGDNEPRPSSYWSVAASPNAKSVAAADADGIITLWAAERGTELQRFQAHESIVYQINYSADGATLASGGNDHSLRLWDTAIRRQLRLFGKYEGIVDCAVFSPDGKILATPGEPGRPGIYLRETLTGKIRVCLDCYPTGAYSPDGRLFATQAPFGAIHVFDVATGKELHKWEGHANAVESVAFSPDGKILASGSSDTTILLWDVTNVLKRQQGATLNLGPRELDALWADLAGNDAAKAHRAIWTLSRAPDQAVPLVGDHLRSLPARDREDQQIAQLIKDLNDDDFNVRDKATQELEKLGWPAEPALRRAAAEPPSEEVRVRVNALLKKVEGLPLPDEVVWVSRALEVLEHAATAEARKALTAFADGRGSVELRREATASLRRHDKQRTPERETPVR